MKLDRNQLAWCLGGGVLLAFFVGSTVSEIFPNHFRTWHVNSNIEPTTEWAMFWRSSRPYVSVMAYVLSGVSGFIGVIRALRGEWITTAARVGVSFLFSVFVEVIRIGVQDGSVADRDVVPTFSLVWIAVGLLMPVAFAVFDLKKLSDAAATTAAAPAA